MHWMCCCCFDQSLLLRRFSLNFPLEQLKIPKFSRLRRKKTPARYARRQGWGQLDYPDRHHHAYPLRTPRRRPRRHRCRCCNGDNSGDVGSGDDGGSKSSSDGPAALHQHEQDRLGRARVGERARDPASQTRVQRVQLLLCLLKISAFVWCLRL